MIAFVLHQDFPSGFPVAAIPRLARACSLLKKKYQTKKFEVGVTLVTERAIKELNKQYRGKNVPTDVLSFSSEEGERMSPVVLFEPTDLGDLVICPSYAAKEAKRRGIEANEELVRLLVHGTLHLMGYDHADDSSEHRMFLIQERIVEASMKRL